MGNILGVKKEDEEGPNQDGKRTDIQDDAFTVNAGKARPPRDLAAISPRSPLSPPSHRPRLSPRWPHPPPDRVALRSSSQDGPAADPSHTRYDEKEGNDEDGDYKKDSMYGENAMKANVAQSEFAKTKSIKEQRAFLPIYGCRTPRRPLGASSQRPAGGRPPRTPFTCARAARLLLQGTRCST